MCQGAMCTRRVTAVWGYNIVKARDNVTVSQSERLHRGTNNDKSHLRKARRLAHPCCEVCRECYERVNRTRRSKFFDVYPCISAIGLWLIELSHQFTIAVSCGPVNRFFFSFFLFSFSPL